MKTNFNALSLIRITKNPFISVLFVVFIFEYVLADT